MTRLWEIIPGVGMGLGAMAILIGFLWPAVLEVYTYAAHRAVPPTESLIMSLVSLIVSIFCALVSYRLLISRDARVRGRILSPMGWRFLGSAFALFTAFMVISTVWLALEEWVDLPTLIWLVVFGVIANLVLAWSCFFCAKQQKKTDQEDAE